MGEDDAAKIINSASRPSGIDVKGVDKSRGAKRDPYRAVRIVTVWVPPCDQYAKGANLYVHPRQVLAHLNRFPGSRVIDDRTFKSHRPFKPTDVNPEGHRKISDIVGPNRDIIRSDDA